MRALLKVRYRFDDPRVARLLDRQARAGLNRYGATVRMYARRSIRPRNRASEPGQPPSSRTGKLRNLLFYAYDPSTRSVVVGPSIYGSPRGNTVPEILEYGGMSTIGVWRTRGGRVERERKAVKVLPRPFMQPVHDKLRPKLPAYVAGTIR